MEATCHRRSSSHSHHDRRDGDQCCCHDAAECACGACMLCVCCPVAIVCCCIKLPWKLGWKTGRAVVGLVRRGRGHQTIASSSSFSDIDFVEDEPRRSSSKMAATRNATRANHRRGWSPR
ncbi:hypothetical protein ACLOJK_033086 [Asimina triloba]